MYRKWRISLEKLTTQPLVEKCLRDACIWYRFTTARCLIKNGACSINDVFEEMCIDKTSTYIQEIFNLGVTLNPRYIFKRMCKTGNISLLKVLDLKTLDQNTLDQGIIKATEQMGGYYEFKDQGPDSKYTRHNRVAEVLAGVGAVVPDWMRLATLNTSLGDAAEKNDSDVVQHLFQEGASDKMGAIAKAALAKSIDVIRLFAGDTIPLNWGMSRVCFRNKNRIYDNVIDELISLGATGCAECSGYKHPRLR
jgi:hypothetical protein